MTTKIEVFYTGGGIALAETAIDKTHYAVINTEAPEFLTVYKYDDDGETTYLPEDMTFGGSGSKIPPELQPLYEKMLDALKSA